jgi:hypothetical protein
VSGAADALVRACRTLRILLMYITDFLMTLVFEENINYNGAENERILRYKKRYFPAAACDDKQGADAERHRIICAYLDER